MKIRLPLRFQIAGLLFVFVGATAFLSGRTILKFIETDKVRSMRDMQVLWVGQSAREMTEKFLRTRRRLEETARSLLDPALGERAPDPKTWRWVRVGSHFWRAPELTEAPVVPAELEKAAGLMRVGNEDVVLSLPLVLIEGGAEKQVFVQARFDAQEIFLETEEIERGSLRGLIVDLRVTAKSAEALPPSLVGTKAAQSAFASIWESFDKEDRSALRKKEAKAVVRVIPIPERDDDIVVAWAPVSFPALDAEYGVLSFITRREILQGFRRTFYELGFYAFLLFGFGFLASRWLASRLSKPIEQMVEATRVLETGNFNVRVPTGKRTDEIGTLAAAFNHMGEALDEREKALKAAQGALVQSEKLAAVGTLSAGLAHEVKNPLAGILSNADLAIGQIQKLELPENAPLFRYVEIIRKETARCRGIIDSLMRFSREEKAEMTLIDLELVTWEAINLTEHTLNMAQVRVNKDFAPDLFMIRGNANQVEQVLLNMMQNAGHAMEGGGTVTLKTKHFADPASAPVGRYLAYVSEHFSGGFCRVTISDTGVGMSDEVQRKIFEPFFTTKPRGQGTGLGLAVTMGILAEHQSRISIDSAPGEGTTFHIDFMAREPRNEEVLKELEEMRHRRSGGAKLSTDVAAVSVAEGNREATSPSVKPPPPPTRPAAPPGLGSLAASESVADVAPASRFSVRKPKVR